jgi:hypothetical protein
VPIVSSVVGPGLGRVLVITCPRAGAAAIAALALAACAGNLECNGHPCIGDWKRDMALGGNVVQCADGAWSHAGGLGNACSGHGGLRARLSRR